MSASQDNTDELDKTLLGQLIAEIAKFGGSDKSKASQLAKILLPYIDAYANLARTEAAREALKSLLKNGNDKMPKGTQRINGKTGRVEFMEEHQIVHDWQIIDRIEQLSTSLKSDGEVK